MSYTDPTNKKMSYTDLTNKTMSYMDLTNKTMSYTDPINKIQHRKLKIESHEPHYKSTNHDTEN